MKYMTSYQPLIDHIQKKVLLSEEELGQMVSCFKPLKVKKRQLIIQPHFIATHRNYVLKGALRAYVVDDEGQEHTIQLAIEDWWISDYNSYIFQQPASMFVVALEDSQLLQISYEQEARLKKENHHFETFFRITAERSTAFMQRRLISGLTQTAEQRYESFMSQYPQIARRVPQYALASYLGMSTEYLSKLRNHALPKKS
jgi:CRP-like cAMP-binding protein